jgi:hypothetical protein
MNKKILFIIIIVCILLIGAYFFIFLSKQNSATSAEETSDTTINVPTKKPMPSATTKTHTDEAGFTFEYPDDIVLTPKKATDAATYADIELTSPDNPGNIEIKVTDTKLKTLDAWLKANNVSTEGATFKPVTLAELDAKQMTTSKGTVVATIDNGVLFTIMLTEPKDKDYWQAVYDKIISTFAFVATEEQTNTPSSSGAADTSGGGEEVFQGDDVIE